MKKVKAFLYLLLFGDTGERLIPKGFILWLENHPNKEDLIKDLYNLK